MKEEPQRRQRRAVPVDARVRRLTGAAAVLAVLASLVLADVLAAGPLTRLDGPVADGLHQWFTRRPHAAGAASVVSFIGSAAVGVPLVLCAVAALAVNGERRLALFTLLTPAVGKVLERVLKVLVGRPRPSWSEPLVFAPGFSFPSGHAMGVTVVVGTLAVVLLPQLPAVWRRPMLGIGVGWVLLVAFSRLALGVHYLTDVVAGVLLGGAWLALMTALIRPGQGPQRSRRC